MMWTVIFKRGNSDIDWSYWVDGDDPQDALHNAVQEARRYTNAMLTLVSIRNERGDTWKPEDLKEMRQNRFGQTITESER